ELATNKFPPDNSRALGKVSPETSVGFTVAPEVVYSPIVPLAGSVPPFTTNNLSPETTMPPGKLSPETSAGFTSAPEVVYSLIVPARRFATNSLSPEIAMPCGKVSPETSAGFISAPEVVYLAMLPAPGSPWPEFTTNICAQVVPGRAESAAAAVKPERIDRMFKRPLSGRKQKPFQR